MNEHGAAREAGAGLPPGSDVITEMLNSIPSEWRHDSSAQEPWNAVAAATTPSLAPSRLQIGTHDGRAATIPRNAVRLAQSFTQYRWPAPPPSQCSTLPHDRVASDSGYGTVQSALRLGIDTSSVYGDNNTDTQSLVGYLSNFELQPSSLTPIDSLYGGVYWDLSSGPAVHAPQPANRATNSQVCPSCPMECKTKSELKKHMQRHTKPHHCREPGCARDEGFSTPNDLERHKKSVHKIASGRQFRCHHGACKENLKIWPRADNFRQHLRRRHKLKNVDVDLEKYHEDEESLSANEVINAKQVIVSSQAFSGHALPSLEPSDAGHDPGEAQNRQQALWPATQDTQDSFAEDRFPQDTGENCHPSLPVSFDDAGLMVGGQFTVFSPTTPDSQDVNLHAIDRPSPMMDIDLGAFGVDQVTSETLSLTAHNPLPGTLIPTLSLNNGYDTLDHFNSHGSLHHDFSDLPHDTRDPLELDDDGSSTTENDNNIRCRTGTPDEDCAPDDDSSVDAENDDVPDDMDAPGEVDSPRDMISAIQATCTTRGAWDGPGEVVLQNLAAMSPAVSSRFEQHREEAEEADDVEEGEASDETTKTAFIETLRTGQLDQILKEHGYRKFDIPQTKSKKPSAVPNGKSPSTEGTGNSKCPEPGCSKAFKRECELRKHKRRHERPYCCTFRDCNKKFGSKSDWTRHEDKQHDHENGWRCDVPLSGLEPGSAGSATALRLCGKQHPRSKTFKAHLYRDHSLSEDEVNAKLKLCHYGTKSGSRFWCGLCNAVVSVGGVARTNRSRKNNGEGGWTDRYDHIDDHVVGRTFLKKTMDEWKYEETETTEAELESIEPEQQVQRHQDQSQQHQQQLKADMVVADQNESRVSRRRGKALTLADESKPTTHWRCCQCENHNTIGLTTQCIGHELQCAHHQCLDCRKYIIVVDFDDGLIGENV